MLILCFWPGPSDAHSSRLTDFLRHCHISYRSGTRYNPQEKAFEGPTPNLAGGEDPNAIQVVTE